MTQKISLFQLPSRFLQTTDAFTLMRIISYAPYRHLQTFHVTFTLHLYDLTYYSCWEVERIMMELQVKRLSGR